MIFCNVQVQDVFIRKVLLALGASVGVRLQVVHIKLFDGGKRKWVVWWEQALHDGRLFRNCRLGVQLYKLDIDRLLA